MAEGAFVSIDPEPSLEICSPRTCIDPIPCLNNGTCTDTSSPDIAVNDYSCGCRGGYFGIGCQNFDSCSLQPCHNGGTCTVDQLNPRQFVCSCPPSTTGSLCEMILSPCSSSPCENGGICRDGVDTTQHFDCLCLPGFSGEVCEVDIDECSTSPCQNGGTCSDGVNSYTCQCPPDFSGVLCDSQVVFCMTDSCANGGSCVEEMDGFSCQCGPGWTGPECHDNINECLTEVCENGSTCMDRPGSFVCLCPAGFTGPACSDEIDFCLGSPCNGNGNCTSSPSGFDCLCDDGYTGKLCDKDIDECAQLNPCLNNATCIDGINHFTCICSARFTGLLCDTTIDNCVSNPCLNGGTCVENGTGVQCICEAGFSGRVCETRINFCTDSPCFINGNCTNTDSGFECECPEGWSGTQCQFVNSVSTKLASCGIEGAVDIFSTVLLTQESVAFTPVSSPIEIQYSLSSEVLYYSSWVWQEEGTTGTIFSFTNSTDIQVGLVSNTEFNEVTLYYSSPGLGEREISLTNTALTSSQWHHIAISLSSTECSLAIDTQTLLLDHNLSDLVLPQSGKFTVGGGGTKDQFIGIMRGAALYDGVIDLSAVKGCLVGCVGGDGHCQNEGTCYDQFSQHYLCQCTFGYSGPFCQYLNTRLSFEQGGSATLNGLQQPLSAVQLEFKSSSSTGQIFSHSTQTFLTSVSVNGSTLHTTVTHCDSHEQDINIRSAQSPLDNLKWHSVELSYTQNPDTIAISLDESLPIVYTLTSANCSLPSTFPLVLGGGAREPINGCLRDLIVNSSPLNPTLLQFTGEAQFGCKRDTVQFFGQSYLQLPQFLSPQQQTLTLTLNARSSEGVIYYSHRLPSDATGDNPIDFLALYLSSGQLRFSYNLGEDTTTITLPVTVDDGEWHVVEASLNGTMGVLTVDGQSVQGSAQGPLNMLDTTASVLLGGVPPSERVTSFSEYSNYDGCVQDLEQNGVTVDLQSFTSSQNVRFGT